MLFVIFLQVLKTLLKDKFIAESRITSEVCTLISTEFVVVIR